MWCQEFQQTETESEVLGLIADDLTVTAEAAVSAANNDQQTDNKIKDDDIDLALDALRNCDTDFIKFDEVKMSSIII